MGPGGKNLLTLLRTLEENDKKFNEWHRDFEAYLMMQKEKGAYELMIGELINPLEDPDIEEEDVAVREMVFKRANTTLYGTLMLAVSPAVRNIIQDVNRGGLAAYNKLLNHFRGRNATRVQNLLDAYATMSQGANESIAGYAARLDVIHHDLELVDQAVSQERKIQKILTSQNAKCSIF